jgi:hypothetical protein
MSYYYSTSNSVENVVLEVPPYFEARAKNLQRILKSETALYYSWSTVVVLQYFEVFAELLRTSTTVGVRAAVKYYNSYIGRWKGIFPYVRNTNITLKMLEIFWLNKGWGMFLIARRMCPMSLSVIGLKPWDMLYHAFLVFYSWIVMTSHSIVTFKVIPYVDSRSFIINALFKNCLPKSLGTKIFLQESLYEIN